MTENLPTIHIAFADTSKSTWTGGETYGKNLLEALQQHAPQVKVTILTEQKPEIFVQYPNYPVITYVEAKGRVASILQKISTRYFGYDFSLHQALEAIPNKKVDLVFPSWQSLGKKTASLCWIPDFQHKHLKELYSSAQLENQDLKFRHGAEQATLVVLSSQDALKDFSTFFPKLAHKGRVMNFVAHVPRDLDSTELELVRNQYYLPERFFYLPNQFWKHKNHELVFQALKLLHERNIKPFVVLTGNPIDGRHPKYFADLMQKISILGIREQIAFLGLVPHNHVYALIRQSLAVLNPSLFEGWSTTVEEAKSVGKRLIISNLSVHQEQNPPEALYFDPHDVSDLATKLEFAWQNYSAGPDLALETQARRLFPERMKNFADKFVAIASEAIAIVHNKQ